MTRWSQMLRVTVHGNRVLSMSQDPGTFVGGISSAGVGWLGGLGPLEVRWWRWQGNPRGAVLTRFSQRSVPRTASRRAPVRPTTAASPRKATTSHSPGNPPDSHRLHPPLPPPSPHTSTPAPRNSKLTCLNPAASSPSEHDHFIAP